ncbi:unnamed protein product [Didymodactylos carnosus]|uniref:Uncharacterized protein n=1 Tax=Didymodactylos carnosus TaxID=1234261 RepID=A0A815K609_9BILA|nr:unnamed protein product [Didymodactylos carnosus]CAF1385585.1 unnamed protein product [Didymodactylos carnosus]CAF4063344.1 unnamed protein product [Didymodactylos carnosus]CAF4280688.1 unnamed protein product [Didymodactylos carnosus]
MDLSNIVVVDALGGLNRLDDSTKSNDGLPNKNEENLPPIDETVPMFTKTKLLSFNDLIRFLFLLYMFLSIKLVPSPHHHVPQLEMNNYEQQPLTRTLPNLTSQLCILIDIDSTPLQKNAVLDTTAPHSIAQQQQYCSLPIKTQNKNKIARTQSHVPQQQDLTPAASSITLDRALVVGKHLLFI